MGFHGDYNGYTMTGLSASVIGTTHHFCMCSTSYAMVLVPDVRASMLGPCSLWWLHRVYTTLYYVLSNGILDGITA
jgi:hypothetical protein